MRWPSWAPGPSLTVLQYSLWGRKATLKKKNAVRELRSCVKVEVAVLGLIVLTVSVDIPLKKENAVKEPRRCVKVEVDVLSSPFLTLIVH